jgi:predicted DNA-binding transcriptional regulator YafY
MMNRFDRIVATLLLLRSGRSVSATDLAARFEISPRTVYRDIDTLSSLGVPVSVEEGRDGGFRLLDGFFLPPLMFSREEAISLLLGLALLHNLRAKPFPTELETAQQKLLAAVPEPLQDILARADRIMGFESLPDDVFHPEPTSGQPALTPAATALIGKIGRLFLEAILEQRLVRLQYRSPYRAGHETCTAEPLGMFWDRDRWYLVGKLIDEEPALRLWRADRVAALKPDRPIEASSADFDIQTLLGRRWLKSAMERWMEETPVKIRLSPAQAERLRQDWYYRHARFELLAGDQILMTYGEDNRDLVLDLLRWLGPGAELIEPKAWRPIIRAELEQMLASYR